MLQRQLSVGILLQICDNAIQDLPSVAASVVFLHLTKEEDHVKIIALAPEVGIF